jgi:hypothetical protein
MNDHEQQDKEDRERAEWALGDYANDAMGNGVGCPNCGRMRLCVCPNGKHRCEKCNWCPELQGYAPFFD